MGGTYATLWTLMCSYRSLCVLLDFNGRYVCDLMDFNGSLCVSLGPYAFLLILLGLYWS